MSEHGNKGSLHLLCGLSSEEGIDIKTNLISAARHKGYEAVCVSRYRKEGISQYIAEHPEFRTVILQETMQYNYPYLAEELAELTDDCHLNVIVSLHKSHKANKYMQILYTAGILNALYEEDATVDNILRLILCPRTRKECRAYYQIENAGDALQALEIIDGERLKRYLSYLEEAEGREDALSRYRYINSTLKTIEKIHLVQNVPEKVKRWIGEDEEYQYFINIKGKKRWPARAFKKKGAAQKETVDKHQESPHVTAREIEENAENEYHEKKEFDAGSIIKEDISDLLGFGGIADYGGDKEIPAAEAAPPAKPKTEKGANGIRNKGKDTAKILVALSVLIFFAAVILFGFFLYSETQREKITPAILSGKQRSSDDQMNVRNPVEVKHKEETRTREKTDIPPKAGNTGATDKGTGGKEYDPKPATETGGGPEWEEAQNIPATEPVKKDDEELADDMTLQGSAQTPPPETDIEISTQVESTVEPVAEPTSSVAQNYNGMIYNGNEVAAIAFLEERRGTSLYIRTRERGEGYCSAIEIANRIEDSCSYLAKGMSGGQLSFIEQ